MNFTLYVTVSGRQIPINNGTVIADEGEAREAIHEIMRGLAADDFAEPWLDCGEELVLHSKIESVGYVGKQTQQDVQEMFSSGGYGNLRRR